jgi:hypothetical protein
MASGSSPPRPALLPKELDDLEDRWAEEHPTVVYPNSTAMREEEPPDRPTEIPDIPGDEFARRLMAAAGENPEAFLRDRMLPEGIPSAILDREAETHRPRRVRESPQSLGSPEEPPHPLYFEQAPRPSTFPTAPPSLPSFASSRRPGPELTLADEAPVLPEAESRGWNGRALEATLRPPRSLTPRSYAAQSFEFPNFASAPPANAVPISDMKDRFAMGDFSGALQIADSILARDPGHNEARNVATKCQEVLLDMYGSRMPNLDEPPRLVMAPAQLRWLTLDHRAGFLLSMIDGMSTVEEILDISGMPRLEAMRILCELIDKRVITVGN